MRVTYTFSTLLCLELFVQHLLKVHYFCLLLCYSVTISEERSSSEREAEQYTPVGSRGKTWVWLWMLLRHFYYPTYFGLYLEGVFMVQICCANHSVFTSKAKCDTNTLNKLWLDRERWGRCMVLDSLCGFSIIAEFKHRFRECKAWVHFSLKRSEICVFRNAGVSQKSKFIVHKHFLRQLMKSVFKELFHKVSYVPFGRSCLVARKRMDS